MLPENPELWAKAQQARDKLANRALSHPEVSLIDIDYEPGEGAASQRVVLRAHVRQPVDRQAIGLPDEVDGIPVRVIVADYRLEKNREV